MKQSEITQLSEYLLKGGMLLYDTLSDNHDMEAILCLSCDTSQGTYTLKIEFEPKEGESDENE